MGEDRFAADETDERLYEVLLGYLESVENGDAPDPRELIARHPEFAPDLNEYFETRARVETLAEPVRWVTRAVLNGSVDAGVASAGTTAQPAVAPAAEVRVFGDYELCEEIGRGGMCVVFKARHKSFGRLVALKMVRGSRLSDQDAHRRFRNEAETAAALEHPNIVPIYEIAEEDGQLYFTMKFLEGGSLKDRLAGYPADPEAAARLMIEVARAVGYAHRRGVLHRDLKPSNVLLDEAGRPHVADFGLAKWLSNSNDLTHPGTLLGTPSYMAPEQASPVTRLRSSPGTAAVRPPVDAITTAADIYGLGAVLYALLTGRPPFSGDTLLETLESVRRDLPTPPRTLNRAVDRDLETVCLKCLEKDPAHRYGSAEELADDLERWLANEPVRAHRASFARRLWLLSRRRPALAGLAAAAVVFAPLLILSEAMAVVRVGRERDRALAQEARATSRERQVRGELYAADLTIAHRDWQHGDVNSLSHLLDRWRPEAGEEDLRDCAWRLLNFLRQADPLYPPRTEPVHDSDVYHVAVSPDGQTVATVGKDGTLRLRKAGSAAVVLREHRGEVNWVAFDSAGQRLATASDDGTAIVWDADKLRPVLRLKSHEGEVVAAVFTPGGDRLITGGRDGTLRQWQLPSGNALPSLKVAEQRIAALAVAPDGERVAIAAKDGDLRVWNLATGKSVFQRALAGQAQCVAYDSLGRTLAAGDIAGHLWLFSARDGQMLRAFTCDNGCAIEGVAFAPDGETLASCGVHGRVRLWDLQRYRLRRNLDIEAERVWSVCFSPNGQTLICGANDGAVRSRDVATAHAWRLLPAPATAACCSLRFSPDSSALAVAAADGTVSFWDPQTCRERLPARRLSLPVKGPMRVAYEDDSVFCVCQADGSLERWNLNGPSRLNALAATSHPPRTLCRRPHSGEWFACLEGAAPVHWHAATGQSIPTDIGGEPCTAAAWSPDGNLLAVALPGRLRLLRDNQPEPIELRLSRGSFSSPSIAFSPDGRLLAAVDYGGIIHLWETAGWHKGPVLQGRQLSVQSIAFSPSSKILAGGGQDGTVKIWYVPSGRELFTFSSCYGGRVFDLEFAPDGSCLAAACENQDGVREVSLWPAPAPER
jgi:WD40 repeat protein/tRNA A-37 threonylcarbamoyl transferase component Bud32